MGFALNFIDLFSGCGGLSLGLMNAGWQGIFAIEQSQDAFKTLRHNLVSGSEHNQSGPRFNWPETLDIRPYDIRSFCRFNERLLKKLRGKIQLVAGGPPCQGFSFAGKRNGNDPRNKLFKHHLAIVDILRPELVLMENVQGIDIVFGGGNKRKKKKPGRPRKSYANRIKDLLENHEYTVQQQILKASSYGVPQVRPRYFTIGIRKDLITHDNVPNLFKIISKIRHDFLRERGCSCIAL